MSLPTLDGGVEVTDLHALLENSLDLICLASTDGYLKWVNRRFSEVLGWSEHELTSRPFLEFVHPADLDATIAEVAKLEEGIPAVQFENRYRTRDDGWRWLAWNTTPRDHGQLFCIVRDVTDRHEADREMQARLRQLELAERLSRVGTWRIDLKKDAIHWSDEVYRIHGRDPATYEPELQTAIEAYHRADRHEVRHHLDRAIEERSEFSFRLRLIRADTHEPRLVHSSGVVQVDEEGDPTEVVGVFQDITDIARAEQSLRDANQNLERRMAELEERSQMMSHLSELGDMLQSAIDLDESRDVLRALLPRIFHGLSGVVCLRESESSEMAEAAQWGSLEGPWRHAEPTSCWAVRRGTVHAVHHDGVLRCRHLRGVPAGSRCVPLSAHGQLVGLLVLVAADERDDGRLAELGSFPSNVADQIALAVSNVRLRERLRRQSLRDQLTGLYNRRFFDAWLAKQVCQVRRTGGQLGVAMMDLDHFKRFNDTYGHLVADELLVRLAEALRDAMREEDVVCRWGGEEFLAAFPGAGPEDIVVALDRIRERLGSIEVRDDDGLRASPPTLSAGVACFPMHATTQEQLLADADGALYEAKRTGRNKVIVAGPRAA